MIKDYTVQTQNTTIDSPQTQGIMPPVFKDCKVTARMCSSVFVVWLGHATMATRRLQGVKFISQ
jgi:hypothetical protein